MEREALPHTHKQHIIANGPTEPCSMSLSIRTRAMVARRADMSFMRIRVAIIMCGHACKKGFGQLVNTINVNKQRKRLSLNVASLFLVARTRPANRSVEQCWIGALTPWRYMLRSEIIRSHVARIIAFGFSFSRAPSPIKTECKNNVNLM